MAYTPYYAPYQRPVYYNPSIPQDIANMQVGQQMNIQQPQQMPMQSHTPFVQAQSSGDTMLWVLNENEASSFPVAPNNSVVLWDKNQKTFYIKTANAQGIPSMQIYDFTERTETPQNTPNKTLDDLGDKFVTLEQFEALQGKLKALESKFEENAVTQVTKPNKSKKGDAE